MTRDELSADKVIAKIHELKGNLSMVARSFGMSRQTMYNYLKGKPTVQAALDEARETMVDNVESALYSKALAGEGWAVCFFLKTQGKHRGYVERSEITGADGGAIKAQISWKDFIEASE
jgi:20S proteasome alpha/beta subunit